MTAPASSNAGLSRSWRFTATRLSHPPVLLLVGLLVSVGFTMGAARAADDKSPLSGDEIRTLVTGNSITGTTKQGPFTMYAPIYGEIRGLRGYNYQDQGTWRVTDDEVCVKWNKWWAASERCWKVSVEGDKVTWVRPDGRYSDSAHLVQGNPDRL